MEDNKICPYCGKLKIEDEPHCRESECVYAYLEEKKNKILYGKEGK